MVCTAFFLYGVMAGLSLVGYSELKVHFEISAAQLGALLTAAGVVSLPVQFMAGALLHRYGKGVWVAVCIVRAVMTATIVLAAHAWNLYFILPFVMLAGGVGNVVMNAGAIHFEHEFKRPVAATAHALFSVGAIVGSAGTGVLLAVGAGFRGVYLTVAALSLSALWVTDVAQGLAHDKETGQRPPFDWSVLHSKSVLLLTAIVSIGAMGEAVMYVWPAIYLRDSLSTLALVGALGSTAFFAAMATGRFALIPVQKRYTRVTVLTASGALIVIGIALALSSREVPVVIAGFVIVGVAYAAVVPLGFSVAGSIAEGKPAVVASIIGTSTGVAFLIAPSVVGALAAAFSLRFALSLVALTGAFVFVGSLVLSRSAAARQLTH